MEPTRVAWNSSPSFLGTVLQIIPASRKNGTPEMAEVSWDDPCTGVCFHVISDPLDAAFHVID